MFKEYQEELKRLAMERHALTLDQFVALKPPFVVRIY
jgi:hypothetical protein